MKSVRPAQRIPAEDCHQLMRRRAVLRGDGRAGLAEASERGRGRRRGAS